MSKKSLGKRKLRELEIDNIVEKVNKRKKRNEIINNRIFSDLSENEKEVLKGHWMTIVINLINESCSDIGYLVNEIQVVENATIELKKMSFLRYGQSMLL